MNDTDPEIEELYYQRMMAFSGEERLRMVSDMFATAKQIILSSFPPDLPELEVRRRLCERLYGDEIDVDAYMRYYEEKNRTTSG